MFQLIAGYAKDVCSIVACAALFIKPFREWLFGVGLIKEGLRCLLRAEVVRMYYRHKDEKKLREFEFKNLEFCYKAYKALKGNSFVDHINAEMQEWEIV